MKKVDGWLRAAVRELTQAGIGTARLDALVLLEDVSGRSRAWLLANPEYELSASQITALKKLLTRRLRHEPLAFIRGKTEFYGRTFRLTSDVLEPRPESETMIDLLKKICACEPAFQQAAAGVSFSPARGTQKLSKLRIADVGTGSGALGITAALELPEARIDLLDVDEKALRVAKLNVDLFTLSISVIKSDLLSNTTQNYDILLCNLPYVPDSYVLNSAAMHEPKIAIFGGPDGLDVYRQLFSQAAKLSRQPLYILSEALPPQHTMLAQIAANNGYDLTDSDDFIQVFRRTS